MSVNFGGFVDALFGGTQSETLANARAIMDRNGSQDMKLDMLLANLPMSTDRDEMIGHLDRIGAIKMSPENNGRYIPVEYSEIIGLPEADDLVVDYNAVAALTRDHKKSAGRGGRA